MPFSADVLKADRQLSDRVKGIVTFGFTERQAGFLVTVMLHSGVFVGRQYAAFAGITHGQKVHDFVEKLLARRLATALQFGPTGRVRLFHVHHKPLYAAIGEPENRNRKPVGIGRAIERLMVLDAVLAEPNLVWLGTEKDKRRHFILHLRDRLRPDEYPRLVFGTPPDTTERYFPDKLPIGVEPFGHRHVLLYLATGRTPMDFRLFLLRHMELLSAVGSWTVRVLLPRHRASQQKMYLAAAYDHLGNPLSSSTIEELRASFRKRRSASDSPAATAHGDAISIPKSLREPRFTALYRRWLDVGDTVLWLAGSPVFRDALERREGRIECVTLPHAYLHLSSLAGSS